MSQPLRFTFGVPLIGREAAGDWDRIEALFELTLSSLLAQTDGDFEIVVAGHDRPGCLRDDRRVSFLRADWPAQPPDSANSDGGRKKEAIKRRVVARGGGLLMFVDADDWVDARLVETARARIEPRHVGAVIRSGYALDMGTLRAARLPDPRVCDLEFDRVCGSSTVLHMRPERSEPEWRDPYTVFHEHYRFVELARQHRMPVATLPVPGCYAINTAENHSELHGPFTDWRRELCQRVNRHGMPLDPEGAARFGLGLEAIRAACDRLFS